jgi:hypothetical protein
VFYFIIIIICIYINCDLISLNMLLTNIRCSTISKWSVYKKAFFVSEYISELIVSWGCRWVRVGEWYNPHPHPHRPTPSHALTLTYPHPHPPIPLPTHPHPSTKPHPHRPTHHQPHPHPPTLIIKKTRRSSATSNIELIRTVESKHFIPTLNIRK